jgi:hypothetical protein
MGFGKDLIFYVKYIRGIVNLSRYLEIGVPLHEKCHL